MAGVSHSLQISLVPSHGQIRAVNFPDQKERLRRKKTDQRMNARLAPFDTLRVLYIF